MSKNSLPFKPLLLTPGPVPAPAGVLKKLSEPMIHHRSQSFVRTFMQTRELLQKVFQTSKPVLILNSSGTGAMSASLLNTLSPGDTVLALSAGKFGERWIQIAKAYKLKVLTVTAPYGKAISVKKVKAVLQKKPHIKAILLQACETSTGVLHPVRELARLVKNNPHTLIIVDAISALGTTPVQMDRMGIDVLIGGAQKFFALPAGLSFIALSKKAWQFNERSHFPVYYFDLKKELAEQAKGQSVFSANVSSIRALHHFLSPLKKPGGLKKMHNRSKKLSQITLQFCKKKGLTVFADPPSPSLTSILLPSHLDGLQIQNRIEKKHKITFGGGQGSLKGRIIRVGHLGDIKTSDLKKALNILLSEISS